MQKLFFSFLLITVVSVTGFAQNKVDSKTVDNKKSMLTKKASDKISDSKSTTDPRLARTKINKAVAQPLVIDADIVTANQAAQNTKGKD